MENNQTPDPRLELAQNLVSALEAGNTEEAEHLIGELVDVREGELFREIGRMTRELHEAINHFLLDDRLKGWAHEDIPDATLRLNHVITMTEDSAHKTLSAVEAALPIIDILRQQSVRFRPDWRRFRRREMAVEEFRQLSQDLMTFFEQLETDSALLQNKMSEVVMAQDYQDLTGQIIRKVIRLIGDLEDKLVDVLRISGTRFLKDGHAAHDKEVLSGPAVPGVDDRDAITSQDDVDDLLSSLGF